MAQRFSYDDVYKVYAWREDNVAKLVLTQGEGLSDSASSFTNTYVKTAKFQLRDDQGIIVIPSDTAATLALKKSDGSEALVEMFTSYTDSTGLTADKNNGIVTFAIKRSMTDVSGEMKGEIHLTTTTGIIKFYGIKFYVCNGVSDAAAEQSEAFSALVAQTSKVEALLANADSFGNLTALDDLNTLVAGGGTHPSTSSVIYNFVTGNFAKYQSISPDNIDSAFDSQTLYHTINLYNGTFANIIVVVGTTLATQYRFTSTGELTYRNLSRSSQSVSWDYTAWGEWKKIGSTSNIQDSAITTSKIANNAVTTDKIQDFAVTSPKIASGAVIEGKIASGAVTESKINNSAVTESKIANSAVTTNKIATKAVTSEKIDDDAITTDKIATLAVTAEKIRNFTITQDKLAIHAVDTENLAIGAVVTDRIADDAIVNSKIKDNAISSGKIANNAVITDKIATNAVTPNKLDRTYKESLSISANEIDDAVQENVIYHTIIDGEVASVRCVYNGVSLRAQYAETVSGKLKYRTQAKAAGEWQEWSSWHLYASTQNIEDSAVTTAKINDLAVTTDKLKDNAIKTGKINDGAVTQSKLAGDSVGTNEIINGSVTTAKINSGAITTGKLDGKAVTTAKLDDDAVTNDKLADDAVDTAQIKNLAVTGAKIANGAVDTAQLAYAAVTNDNIDSNAVGTEEMADGAVTTSKLAASAVTTAKVANGSITPEKLSKAYVDHAPEIFIGTTDKTTTENGTSTKQYSELDRYINKYNGKIWVCTNATQVSDAWVYTWSEKGNFYNYPAQVSYPLNKNAWSNNQIELSGQLWAVADGRKRVDVDIDQATYLQLCADGCAGLFVSTDDSGSTPVFTMNAIGNVPTTDITVQLTLWHVIEL